MLRHTHILRQADGREGLGARVPAKEIAAAGDKFAARAGAVSNALACVQPKPMQTMLLPGSFHDSPFRGDANPKAADILASQRAFGFDD